MSPTSRSGHASTCCCSTARVGERLSRRSRRRSSRPTWGSEAAARANPFVQHRLRRRPPRSWGWLTGAENTLVVTSLREVRQALDVYGARPPALAVTVDL